MIPNDEQIRETGDCSNCRFSVEVAPYKVILKCKLDGKLKSQPHACEKWGSILVNLEADT